MDITALQSMVNVTPTKDISNSAGTRPWADPATIKPPETKEQYASKLSEIASKYDVKHMTADQVGSMAQELHDNGLISTPDFLSMALLPYLMKDGDVGARTAMAKDGTIDLRSYWEIKSVKPSDADTGQKLFDALMSSKDKKASQSSINNQAVASYTDTINKSSFDANRVTNVLDALAAHSQN